MQKDFHYYCIGILARAAGFNPKDALIIAYASQYVDDSTEGERIPIFLNGSVLQFEPVLTSHRKLDALKAMKWSSQKRVWIPFHFIPPKPFVLGANQPFSFITQPGTTFPRLILDQAVSEPLKNHKRRLCRIGIALHTYADSWPHQDFSGRRQDGENDVEGIWVFDQIKGEWDHLFLENIVLDILPNIGHAQAGYFPDLSFQNWKFSLDPSKVETVRNNPEMFLEAAKNIYEQLLTIQKSDPASVIPWETISPDLMALFTRDDHVYNTTDNLVQSFDSDAQMKAVGDYCEQWQLKFGHHFGSQTEYYDYDPHSWRQEALEGNVDWDHYTTSDWERTEPRSTKSGFWDSYWVHFHRGALRQRHFVLENLP